ncbi:MAG: hypothetical protein SFH39_17895 [Candidatus Magnetobacterium sp. LHC-1]
MADLSDSLNATVTKEGLAEAMVGKFRASFVKLSGKQIKVYPRADAREIEKQLIDVLDEIDKILKLIKRPQFIFIFDELDKIEPQPGASEKETSTNEKDATEKAPTSAGSESMPFSTHEARQRQQSIFKILSNLKYFLTTAKAKFIFIAGREIYDASLADVSDRNYFMSSIFHDVLYVNSFLTDSPGDKSADITHMIEQYVCRYLIPSDYTTKGADDDDDGRYSVKTYRKYLHDKITDKAPIKRLKIEKLVVTVNNFITYLTYRSNGSPKKLTRYFEQFVVQPGEEKLNDPSYNLCVAENSNNLYLKFTFFDQYTIGLVSYIATPVMLAIEKTIRNFGDKILVSTAFIVDHIYKYHRHAFTWRNLEVTPEILDINKAPELRELMERIIQFMLKHNLHEILSGPYNFRFTKKMSDEISYLSKISEKESAAFNFTLDESIALKRHYKVYQKNLEKKYATALNAKDTAVIKSISFVHMILGELHFYDEEYHDAIIELMESIQQLSNINDVKDMDVSTFYTYVYTMMLLGLAYEKGKSFSSAFAMYEKTISVMIDYKNKDENKEENKGHLIIKHKQKSKSKYFPESFFENKRHLYQPLLAKLQLIEKRSLNGITDSDIQRIEEEHRKLRGNNFSEKFVVESEFFCRLGDILYYKNGVIPKNKTKSNSASKSEQISDYINEGLCSKFSNLPTEKAKKAKHPCRACEYYTKSLAILCNDQLGIDITCIKYKDNKTFKIEKILCDMLETIPDDNSKDETQKKATELKVIGNLLSNIGDTLLSCITKPTPVDRCILTYLLQIIKDDEIKENVEELKKFIIAAYDCSNALYPVFALYCASALFFMAGRMHKEYSFQFTKILRLIRECLKVPYDTNNGINKIIIVDDALITTIRETLNNRIFQGIYKSYENVHRLEIEKFKGFFDNPNETHNYNNLSISGDIREIIIDYTEIKLRSESPTILEEIMSNYAFISPYTTIYTMRNRIVELNLRAITNVSLWIDFADMKPKDSDYSNYKLAGKPYEKFRRKIKYKQIINIFPSSANKKIEITFKQRDIDSLLVIEFLITDSIFCLNEMIKISKTYAFSYDMNHSYMAATHLKLAIWCEYYDVYKRYNKGIDIKSTLKKLIGAADMVTIDPNYQYEMARYHAMCAIETHTERNAYKNMIDTMYYLNDDFNDRFYHYYAALERFRINTGQIQEIIDIARERIQARIPQSANTDPADKKTPIDELYDSDKYYKQT